MKVNLDILEEKEVSDIESWKEQYSKIYKTTVGDKDYIWRRIKRKEYSKIMSLKDGDDADERIYNRQLEMCKIVVLNIGKEELDNDLEELSGLAITLSEEIMHKSGFSLEGTVEL